jgi:predicted RNase H-like HicB family nuclease
LSVRGPPDFDLRGGPVEQAEPEGGYTALVPILPGCISYGQTITEAKAMITDAIGGYIESLHKHKEPIPRDSDTLISSVVVPMKFNA